MLIGLTGQAGAGKDTVAEMLAEQRGGYIAAFADPLYECVSAITGMPKRRLRDRAVKETVIPWLGRSPRQMLQTLGTEWGRQAVHEDIWVRSLMERVKPLLEAGRLVVVTDVRFDNEAAAVTAEGGEVWRVIRPGWKCLDEAAAGHSSEAGVSERFVTRTITNAGTIDALRAAVAGSTMGV
jgi:hypothetical protein